MFKHISELIIGEKGKRVEYTISHSIYFSDGHKSENWYLVKEVYLDGEHLMSNPLEVGDSTLENMRTQVLKMLEAIDNYKEEGD